MVHQFAPGGCAPPAFSLQDIHAGLVEPSSSLNSLTSTSRSSAPASQSICRHAFADRPRQADTVCPRHDPNIPRILGAQAEGRRPAPRDGVARVPHYRIAVAVAPVHQPTVGGVQGEVENGGDGPVIMRRRDVEALGVPELNGEFGGKGATSVFFVVLTSLPSMDSLVDPYEQPTTCSVELIAFNGLQPAMAPGATSPAFDLLIHINNGHT
ncbi:hypothetical protein PR202_ga09910 [Eleusine coracana subsp. coracana]|uniref:Uncharacterized protein n=1 Tax=Eleusine coracana subsp. coracana TaxID=191504 RepID=A0AAV5C4Y0_ELECO|nr:hypothetical protein PR202_ga09910 [Eleusine coracana subsp. coracana]